MQKRTHFIARLAIILSLTMVIQLAGFPQPITGPLINTMLFITASLMGNIAGVLLGCLTPTVALVRGQLPPVLAPMVLFIALGNATLVLVFNIIVRRFNFQRLFWQKLKMYIGIISAAFFKFLFLLLSVKILLPVILNIPIPDKVAVLMSTPQLITAIIGGVIAIVLLKIIEKAGIERGS